MNLACWPNSPPFQTARAQGAALSAPYFKSEEKWKARGLLAAIVALNLGAVYMLVLINDWNRCSTTHCRTRTSRVLAAAGALHATWHFAYIVIAVYKFYLTQLLQMRWRAWMTRDYLGRWLAGQAFYQMELARFTHHQRHRCSPGTPDNPDQRIQEDVNLFTSYTVGLSMGLLNAVVTLASFVGILWGLSGFGFSFTLGRQAIHHSRLHGVDGRAVLPGRQRAHALHRPPADQR
jgi:putative ATP-binding cassette transporter